MAIKKNDTVKVIAGAHKGKTAVVAGVLPGEGKVQLEGIGVIKRKLKPTQLNPRGGTREIHRGIDISNVRLETAAKATKKKSTKKDTK